MLKEKTFSGVYDQVGLSPAFSPTGTSERLEILDLESTDSVLSRQGTTKVLIKLYRCAG